MKRTLKREDSTLQNLKKLKDGQNDSEKPSSTTIAVQPHNKLLDFRFSFLDLPGATVLHVPSAFNRHESARMFEDLKNLNVWEQRDIVIFGRRCKEGRMTAMFTLTRLLLNPENNDGDANQSSELITHRYSGRYAVELLIAPLYTAHSQFLLCPHFLIVLKGTTRQFL